MFPLQRVLPPPTCGDNNESSILTMHIAVVYICQSHGTCGPGRLCDSSSVDNERVRNKNNSFITFFSVQDPALEPAHQPEVFLHHLQQVTVPNYPTTIRQGSHTGGEDYSCKINPLGATSLLRFIYI